MEPIKCVYWQQFWVGGTYTKYKAIRSFTCTGKAKNVWGFVFSVFFIHFDALILITGIFILTSSFLNYVRVKYQLITFDLHFDSILLILH